MHQMHTTDGGWPMMVAKNSEPGVTTTPAKEMQWTAKWSRAELRLFTSRSFE